MYTFIYNNPDGIVTEFNEVTKEAARDAAQLAFFSDYKKGLWQGIPSEGCIEEEAYVLEPDAVEDTNTTVAIDDASLAHDEFMEEAYDSDDEPDVEGMSIVNDAEAMAPVPVMNTLPTLEGLGIVVTNNGMVFTDDNYDETNDVLDAATEAMNPVEPAPTFKGGWGSDVGGQSLHSDSRTVDYGKVSAVAVERQENHDGWLAELGLARPTENISITKAGYKRGTAVVDYGYESLDAARVVWDEKPDAYDAARQFVSEIEREGREDCVIHMDTMRMSEAGLLQTNAGEFALEEHALKQLLTTSQFGTKDNMEHADGPLFPRGFHTMKSLDPDVRAYVFNEHMKRNSVVGKGVKLRTRSNGSVRSVFGVVSTGYTDYDADRVAQVIADSVSDTPYKADIQYNSKTTNFTMDITMHAPGNLTDFSAGDLYEVGFRFKSNDRGGGSINGSAIAFWNECLNMIILHSEKVEIMRAIHKGDMSAKMEAIREGIENGRPAMERFAKDWGILSNTPISTFISEDDVERYSIPGHMEPDAAILIRKMVMDGNIGDGLGRDAIVQMMLASYDDQGGGDTAQDFINAVTRTAHQHLVDDCARDVMEREAGLLVPMMAQIAIA